MYLVTLLSAMAFVMIYGLLISPKSMCIGVKFGVLFGVACGISMGFGIYDRIPRAGRCWFWTRFWNLVSIPLQTKFQNLVQSRTLVVG
jgi:hypothetical protein